SNHMSRLGGPPCWNQERPQTRGLTPPTRDPVQRYPASWVQAVARGKASRSTQFHPRSTTAPVTDCEGIRGLRMRRTVARSSLLALLLAVASFAAAQTNYRVVSVTDGGTISGTVKWSGPVPRELDFPVTKDPQICDPQGKKTVSLERLIVGPDGGVANTIV